MARCTQCGRENETSAEHCTTCGALLPHDGFAQGPIGAMTPGPMTIGNPSAPAPLQPASGSPAPTETDSAQEGRTSSPGAPPAPLAEPSEELWPVHEPLPPPRQPRMELPTGWATPPPPPDGWRPPPPQGAPRVPGLASPGNSALSVAALVMGILSVTCCCCGIVPGILAVTFALVDRNSRNANQSMDTAALILGIIGITLNVLGWLSGVFNHHMGPYQWNFTH